jgi:Protein of unknown function (DUF3014)
MRKILAWVVLAVAVIALVIGLNYYYRSGRVPPSPPPAVESPPPPAPAAPAPEPQTHYPVPEAQPPAAAVNPETALHESLQAMIGAAALGQYLRPEPLLRRIVATIDELPRRDVTLRLSPLRPIPGPFAVSETAEGMRISERNPERYEAAIRIFESVSPGALVSAYLRVYPELQRIYQALGYPNGYFNDRVVQAIDSLLQTPEFDGPMMLVQPKVFYLYSDAETEDLPIGQKTLLRLSADQRSRLKARLRTIRAALTASATAAQPARQPGS